MLPRVWLELTLADLILFAVIIALIVISAFTVLHRKDDRQVYVYKDNSIFGSYPLAQDWVIRIDGHNTVKIAGGKVMMLEADCPDKRCVKQGAGDALPIICLPNRVVVEIYSAREERKLILH